MNKDEIIRLADEYAHCYAYVGDPSISTTRAALVSALDSADREVEVLKAALGQPVPLSEWEKMTAENAALRSALNNCEDALNNSQTYIKAKKLQSGFSVTCIGANDIALDAARAALETGK